MRVKVVEEKSNKSTIKKWKPAEHFSSTKTVRNKINDFTFDCTVIKVKSIKYFFT